MKRITLPLVAGEASASWVGGWGQDSTFALGFSGHRAEESRFLPVGVSDRASGRGVGSPGLRLAVVCELPGDLTSGVSVT